MTPSFLQTAASALVVLSSIPHTTAFYNIQIADTVAAGTDIPITIVNDIADGSLSFDAGFSNYRVYLSVSAPGSGEGPSCYLVNSSAIDVADFTVQIPASVGPSGSTYAIVTMEFNEDPELDGPSGFQYSDVFTLTGATGEWSEYETDPSGPYGFANPDEVPCTAYNCARECSQKYYPDNIQDQEGTAAEETWNCVAACPGVAYPTWDSLSVDDGDDGDGSDDSSSSYAAATSTSFTGSASSSIIQSSTSTPHSTSASVTSSANTRASTATSTSITSSATSSASGSSTSSSSAPSQTSSGAVDRATIPKFATIFTILVTFVAAVKF